MIKGQGRVYPIKGSRFFPLARKCTVIAHYWLVPDTDSTGVIKIIGIDCFTIELN